MAVKDSHADDHTYRPAPDEPYVQAICNAVATVTDRSMLDLEPLAETVDPDAMRGLLDDSDDPHRSFRFTYEGCTVVVTPDEVRVREQ